MNENESSRMYLESQPVMLITGLNDQGLSSLAEIVNRSETKLEAFY